MPCTASDRARDTDAASAFEVRIKNRYAVIVLIIGIFVKESAKITSNGGISTWESVGLPACEHIVLALLGLLGAAKPDKQPEAGLEISSLIKTRQPKVAFHPYAARTDAHFRRLFAVNVCDSLARNRFFRDGKQLPRPACRVAVGPRRGLWRRRGHDVGGSEPEKSDWWGDRVGGRTRQTPKAAIFPLA